MSLKYNGMKIRSVTLTGDRALETYDSDLTSIEAQHGRTFYVKGKKVTGTGKCFEYAEYGYSRVTEVKDENGNVKYGIKMNTDVINNVLIISTMLRGDKILQTNFLISEDVIKIGENLTAGGNIYAYYDGGSVIVYFENISSEITTLLYFLGKDNEI